MRFHVVANPQSNTTREFSQCGFSQKTIRFCKLLKMGGHTVYLYGGTQNEAICDEFVSCFTEQQRIGILEMKHYTYPSWNPRFPLWVDYRVNVAKAIHERKQPGDFICHLGGNCLSELENLVPGHKVVEYGIGYSGYASKWLVFESYAWMSFCFGVERSLNNPVNPNTHVIHSFYDEYEFPINHWLGTYACFVGRLTSDKGVSEACEAAAKAGVPMLVAGMGDNRLVTHGAKYLGPVSLADRNELMAGALAVFSTTKAFEPFGNVACEAQMCGTPAITSDWGGFVETVENGVSGYRCRNVDQMAAALKKVGNLDRGKIAWGARSKWGLKRKSVEYEEYFSHLASLPC
jgi:glycosyltransferase involved in cell wall biosynthesis